MELIETNGEEKGNVSERWGKSKHLLDVNLDFDKGKSNNRHSAAMVHCLKKYNTQPTCEILKHDLQSKELSSLRLCPIVPGLVSSWSQTFIFTFNFALDPIHRTLVWYLFKRYY